MQLFIALNVVTFLVWKSFVWNIRGFAMAIFSNFFGNAVERKFFQKVKFNFEATKFQVSVVQQVYN